MTDETTITPEEAELLAELGVGSPVAKEKGDLFTFFNKILKSSDTTKVANMDAPEIKGFRTLVNASAFATEMGEPGYSKYIKSKGEVIASSSDSKDGFLIKMAVTQKKESSLRTKAMGAENKSWFKPKSKPEEGF